MKLYREISEAFERNALEYLEKDFVKHKDYLLRVAFGRNSALISRQDFEEALELYNSDPRGCVKRLFQVVLPAIEATMDTVYSRALKLLSKYNSGTHQVKDLGNGMIEVESESNPQSFYKVDLVALECECPYYQKVKFAGMVCKHIFLANEIYGTKYRHLQNRPVKTAGNEPLSKVMITDEFFCYGSQRLRKRKKRGNPLIPFGITYVLEGKQPEVVLYALENNETLLLVGESGVGKSKMIHYLAQETNTPLLNACGHNEITVENLLGSLMVINGNTVWKDGILPEAMRKGYWMLLDEINSIDPGVIKVINELLDTKKITVTVAGEPRLVKAHKDFRFICTMNPPDSPIYKGIETLSFEFMDRFDTVVHIDYLSPETEIKLIMELSGLDNEAIARKIVEFANRIREAMRQGEIFATVTTRSLISFCKKAKVFDLRTAARASILGKMSSTDKDKALDLFNAIFK